MTVRKCLMQKFLIFLCVTMAASASAKAIDVLHCADTGAIGYQWRDGKPTATRYVPLNFVVKIISPTERVIDSPSRDYNDETYRCSERSHPPGILACARITSATSYPINFNGNRYERIGNVSAHVGGAPDLYVAYGICEPF